MDTSCDEISKEAMQKEPNILSNTISTREGQKRFVLQLKQGVDWQLLETGSHRTEILEGLSKI